METEAVEAGKSVSESSVVMAQLMSHQDINTAGNVHGGVIMKLIDTAAGVAAMRHAHSNVVTASIDRLDFHNPAYMGDVLTLKASLNYVGKTSMEVGVRVETENPRTGERRHTASAYLTFVSLDPEGRPRPVPPLTLETDEERRRHREARARREARLAEKKKEKACQIQKESCG
ncbi:MAG: acyl-CoA thioesterase [Deltaproteobacteria bacterium]|nr:acyl-CoA thioesterase [Deltaproteobacteria bacterium]